MPEIYITNIRHKKLLSDAKESLKLVMNSIDDDMPEDFYSIDLMSAYAVSYTHLDVYKRQEREYTVYCRLWRTPQAVLSTY